MTNSGVNLLRMAAIPVVGCLLLVSGACSRRPKEVLSEKEMVSLMTDLQLAQAYSNAHLVHNADDNSRDDIMNGVLATHGVTREQLDTTLGWYGKNLDEYVELYAKIDKELNKRRKKLMKDSEPLMASGSGSDLWPYPKNASFMPLSYSDGILLSIPEPEINKGDRLIWSFHLSENVDLAGQLGVEYSDGSGEASIINRGRNQRMEITLQTDTGKTVSRLYASFRVKDRNSLPLFADSIKLEKLPFDSLEYKSARSQKRYAAPVPVQKVKEEKDSLQEEKDSLKQMNESKQLPDTVKQKPLKNGQEKLKPVTDKGEIKWQPRK